MSVIVSCFINAIIIICIIVSECLDVQLSELGKEFFFYYFWLWLIFSYNFIYLIKIDLIEIEQDENNIIDDLNWCMVFGFFWINI